MTDSIIIKNPKPYNINAMKKIVLEPHRIIIVHPNQKISSKIVQLLEKIR